MREAIGAQSCKHNHGTSDGPNAPANIQKIEGGGAALSGNFRDAKICGGNGYTEAEAICGSGQQGQEMAGTVQARDSRGHEEEAENEGGTVSASGEQYAGGDDSQERSAKLGGEEKSRLGVSEIPTRDEYRERRA